MLTMLIKNLVLVVLIIIKETAFCQDEQSSDLQVQYYGVDESEQGLPSCGNSSLRVVCSTLHKRWWTSNIAVRLCRCSRRKPCSTDFQQDRFTVFMDNRSQFKFCYPMNEIPICEKGKIALTVNATYPLVPLNQFEAAHHANLSITPPVIKAMCQCPEPHYYRTIYSSFDPIYLYKEVFANGSHREDTIEHQNILAKYSCEKLEKCASGEFCGYSRADINSIYYRCSCPRGHLCVHNGGRDMEIVSELLYVGLARKAYCLPHNVQDIDTYDDW